MSGIRLELDRKQLNKINKEFQDYLKQLQAMSSKNVIDVKFKDLSKNTKGMNELTNSTNNFSRSCQGSIGSLAKMAGGLYLASKALNEFKDGLKVAIDANTSLSNIAMITGQSIEDLYKSSEGWTQMAKDMKVVTSEVFNANETFLRAGKSIEEVNSLVETNIMLSRISGDANSETAERMVTLSNAYEKTADEMRLVGDEIAKLDSSTASSSSFISNAISRTAQTAQESGYALEQLMADVATVDEYTNLEAESVGRAFKKMFLNIQEVQKSRPGEFMSDLEKSLSGVGIALRLNEKEWRKSGDVMNDIKKNWSSFDDIQKSQITQQLAGVQFSETLLILLNNQTRATENYNSVLNASGELQNKYNVHLESTQGKMNELKATSEEMWIKFYNSEVVNSAIEGLTDMVETFDFMINDIPQVTSAVGALGVGVVGLTTKFAGLKAVLAFLTANPVVLALTAIGGTFYAVSDAVKDHKKYIDECTKAYEDLNTAIENNDLEAQKNSIESANKLQGELNQKMKEYKEIESDPNAYDSHLIGKQREIDELIEKIEDFGYSVDYSTNKIKELETVQSNLSIDENTKKIEEETKALVDNNRKLESQIDRYLLLDSVEEKSASNKKEMTTLSNILSSKINGLTVVTDNNSNSVITNTDLLRTNKDAISDKTREAINSAIAQATKEKELMKVVVDGTTITVKSMRERVRAYEEYQKSLGVGGNHMTQEIGLDPIELEDKAYKYKEILKDFDKKIKLDSLENLLDQFNSSVSGVTSGGYKPIDNMEKLGKSTAKTNKEMEKVVKNLDFINDRYYKINEKIKANNASTNAQMNNYKKLLELQKEEENELQYKLRKNGVKFDQDGVIENYNEIIKQKTDFANALDGKSKELAIKSVQDFKTDLERYSEIKFELKVDTINNIKEIEQIKKDATEKHKELFGEDVNGAIESINSRIEKKVKTINDKIALIGNIDTEEEKQEYEKLLTELQGVYLEKMKYIDFIRTKMTERLKTATKDETKIIEDSFEFLNQIKIDVEIDYKSNTETLEAELEKARKIAEDQLKEYQNTVESMRDRINNALIKQYDKHEKIQVDYLKEEFERDEAKLNKEIEKLKAEIELIQGKKSDLKNNLAGNKTKLSQLNNLDPTDPLVLKQIHELKEKITEQEKEMAVNVLEEKINAIEKEKQATKEDYDERTQIIKEYYEMQRTKSLRHSNEMLMNAQENQNKIFNLLRSYEDEYKDIGSLFGKSVADSMMIEVKNAINAMKSISSIGGYTGGGYTSGATGSSYSSPYVDVVVRDNNGRVVKRYEVTQEEYDSEQSRREQEELKKAGYTVTKMDTGGYTGDWMGNEGKLAMLHKKERVLSANQTESFEKLVNFSINGKLEKLVDSLKTIKIPTISDFVGNLKDTFDNTNNKQEINNYYELKTEVKNENYNSEDYIKSIVDAGYVEELQKDSFVKAGYDPRRFRR